MVKSNLGENLEYKLNQIRLFESFDRDVFIGDLSLKYELIKVRISYVLSCLSEREGVIFRERLMGCISPIELNTVIFKYSEKVDKNLVQNMLGGDSYEIRSL